ncbi:M28 family metallopeptidase [Zobellia uliginosa]|uniref:M28 family metallopeptidase n=1 Tax=Zobellia uliginosa TaxID=143224 RepID=UPI001C078BF8|nr:M28 family peptidase [Zobellia uliginosa]MBU2949053.1 M20/M25/M40 family metallo-hydrolase [Zobellia uliginosa]
MKKSFLFLTGMLILSCGSSKIDESVTLQSEEAVQFDRSLMEVPKKADEINGINNAVSAVQNPFATATEIGAIMSFLASDELQGRDTGSDGIEKAAEFIENVFSNNNIKPYFDTYRDNLPDYDAPAFNVVGMLEGNDPALKNEFVIVGAHYDHIGLIAEENGDKIANGANDNATGTTTVLELARYFGKSKSNKRSMMFVLFTAEEKGLLGSKHLAQKLKQENLNLYAMINYEMVGVPLVGKDYLAYLTGFEESNMADVVNSYADQTYAGFLPKAKEFNLFKRSDNYPFHESFGVPSQTFSTFDFTNFNHYHKVGDELSEMDFVHMADLINKSIPVIEGVVNASTKEIKYN